MTPSIPTSLFPPNYLLSVPSSLLPFPCSLLPPSTSLPPPSCPPSLPPSHAPRHFILTLVPQRESRERKGREREGKRESREREGSRGKRTLTFLPCVGPSQLVLTYLSCFQAFADSQESDVGNMLCLIHASLSCICFFPFAPSPF